MPSSFLWHFEVVDIVEPLFSSARLPVAYLSRRVLVESEAGKKFRIAAASASPSFGDTFWVPQSVNPKMGAVHRPAEQNARGAHIARKKGSVVVACDSHPLWTGSLFEISLYGGTRPAYIVL